MTENKIIKEMIAESPNRRNFVKKLGMASAAVGAAAATNGVAQTSGPTDFDILNFALNLEYLEAEFYTAATAGMNIGQMGLTITGTGSMGATTGGSQVTFTDPIILGIANELAVDERTHVTLLQTAITAFGGQPIAKPALNLNALGFGFGSQSDFLKLARIFEDIGVTAYGGAAPLISNKTILGYAARILAVEAGHAGNIRLQMARSGISAGPLDGADHAPPPFGPEYFATNSLALSEIRTPQQVLYLAYNAPNAVSGGFFPAGANGTLNMSSATPAVSDGAYITATPNPIPVSGSALGSTTIAWNAPTSQLIQIRVGSPNGALFTNNIASGSMTTGNWITEGVTLYLQDVTGGKPLTAANTLATVILHLQKS